MLLCTPARLSEQPALLESPLLRSTREAFRGPHVQPLLPVMMILFQGSDLQIRTLWSEANTEALIQTMNGAKNTQVTVSGRSRLDRMQTRAGWMAGLLRPRVNVYPGKTGAYLFRWPVPPYFRPVSLGLSPQRQTGTLL